jgi:hypothetical protein
VDSLPTSLSNAVVEPFYLGLDWLSAGVCTTLARHRFPAQIMGSTTNATIE